MKAPAGLDLGAVTPEEIAVSILAEIVQVARLQPVETATAASAEAPAGAAAIDPVCGMAVEAATARHRSEVDGRLVYFCCAGCKGTFDGDPAGFTGSGRR